MFIAPPFRKTPSQWITELQWQNPALGPLGRTGFLACSLQFRLQSAPWGQTEAAGLLSLHLRFPSLPYTRLLRFYLNKSLHRESPSQMCLKEAQWKNPNQEA